MAVYRYHKPVVHGTHKSIIGIITRDAARCWVWMWEPLLRISSLT